MTRSTLRDNDFPHAQDAAYHSIHHHGTPTQAPLSSVHDNPTTPLPTTPCPADDDGYDADDEEDRSPSPAPSFDRAASPKVATHITHSSPDHAITNFHRNPTFSILSDEEHDSDYDADCKSSSNVEFSSSSNEKRSFNVKSFNNED